MKKITFLLLLIISGSFICTAQKQPNIIMILADDLGYGDLSCFGSQRIETPHIDKMAREGKKFTQFYAGSAVCTPTRVSLLTGQYPLRFNVSQHFNDREMFLNNTMLTIPKALKKKGYTSMHVGKWHLGGLNESHIKNRKNSMPGPLEHGFDHYVAMIEDPLYRGVAMREKRLYKDAGKSLVRDDKILAPNPKHWTDIKFDTALSFIEEEHKADTPFYLHLCLDAPHAPYEASTKGLLKKYKDRAKGDDLLYRGMVSHVDQGVGKILQKLKDLDLDKNTLVIFTSDNGPAYLGSPAHFKGRKTDFHEGGIRVPMLAWWPGKITANSQTNQIANTIDFLPTFMHLALGKIHKKDPIDGINISPILFDKKKHLKRETMFWEISSRYKKNGNYYLTTDLIPQPPANQIARNGKWKLLAKEGIAKELYNMEEDPYERWNLLKTYPDVVKKLHLELTNWLKEPRTPKPY